jgi:predicted SAM-dependent methyltransferase
MMREEILRQLFDINGRGLEIGPSHNPLVPKSSGASIESLDYCDAATLREKYKGAPNVDLSRIEEVDHIVTNGSIAQTVNRAAYYDYIVASHVIEHVPDMIVFLRDCQTLLKPDGVLVLAVPDKRYCFDVFQPLSSTGGVLQAHYDRRTRPSLGSIFDELAYNAVSAGSTASATEFAAEAKFFLDRDAALSQFARLRDATSYYDVHVWRFVPSSFRLIVNDLHELGEVGLREQNFRDGHGEFYVTLSQNGAGCPVDRLTLAKQTILFEQAGRAEPAAAPADSLAGLLLSLTTRVREKGKELIWRR